MTSFIYNLTTRCALVVGGGGSGGWLRDSNLPPCFSLYSLTVCDPLLADLSLQKFSSLIALHFPPSTPSLVCFSHHSSLTGSLSHPLLSFSSHLFFFFLKRGYLSFCTSNSEPRWRCIEVACMKPSSSIPHPPSFSQAPLPLSLTDRRRVSWPRFRKVCRSKEGGGKGGGGGWKLRDDCFALDTIIKHTHATSHRQSGKCTHCLPL